MTNLGIIPCHCIRLLMILLSLKLIIITVQWSKLATASSTNSSSYYSTSATNIQRLVRHEQNVVQYLHKYAINLENKINKINKYLQNHHDVGPEVKENCTDLFGFNWSKTMTAFCDPLKSVRILRRLAIDLVEIENGAIAQSQENDFHAVMNEVPVPTASDRADSILSVITLIDTYRLEADQVSSGKLMKMETKSGLSWSQCFELGHYAVDHQLFSVAVDFLDQSLILVNNSGQVVSDSEKNATKTVQLTSKMIEEKIDSAIKLHDENFEEALENKRWLHFFTSPLQSVHHTSFVHRKRPKVTIVPVEVNLNNLYPQEMFNNFKTLCRKGYSEPIIENLSGLKCHLYSKIHPYWTLSPLRVEIHHKDPLIFQVYDVLTNKKMELLKIAAQPSLQPSKIFGNKNINDVEHNILEGNETSFHRSSQNTWLIDRGAGNPYSFVNTLTQLLTGLTTTGDASSEYLQIGNYATGGMYIPHIDAFHLPEFLSKVGPAEVFAGDRIGTMMAYLSDVEQGGGTAFPMLGVVARAVKGSALFWFNLHQNGTINPWTLHGGCPVLYGSKWVVNKWIRSHDQMFRLKCAVENDMASQYFYNSFRFPA